MNTPKLMLTILAGGVGLGAVIGQMAQPAMKFADQPDWRSKYAPDYSATSMQFVGSGPEDLTPMAWYGPSYMGPGYQDPVYETPPEPVFADGYDLSADGYALPFASDALPSDGYALVDTELEQEPAVSSPVIEASANAAEVAAMLSAPSPRVSAPEMQQSEVGIAVRGAEKALR